ncbi:hypothetical protein DPMN_190843 [Dreissena polymorpha]|uniref:Uncharacterized protein n=1 Tax=Dreissena polymorpha TaxID=45954 RepID=A0A9D3XYX3_DREPO|nr:hypothetical protein DPMN_190843 [Dreissena polymorpha]
MVGRLAVNDQFLWVRAATTRRLWQPYSDPTTSVLRLLCLYGVPTTSLTERRKTPDFGDNFENVQRSPWARVLSNFWRPHCVLLRPYCVPPATMASSL